MKNTINKIKHGAALIFDDASYEKLCKYISNNQINDARLMIDNEVKSYEATPNLYHFELTIASRMSDLLIDLITREIDDERRGEQIKSSTE
jgi:hypothetical protein